MPRVQYLPLRNSTRPGAGGRRAPERRIISNYGRSLRLDSSCLLGLDGGEALPVVSHEDAMPWRCGAPIAAAVEALGFVPKLVPMRSLPGKSLVTTLSALARTIFKLATNPKQRGSKAPANHRESTTQHRTPEEAKATNTKRGREQSCKRRGTTNAVVTQSAGTPARFSQPIVSCETSRI